jgi:hypothetical protein
MWGQTNLFIDNQLPVAVTVSPRNARGLWINKPEGLWYTADPLQTIGLNLQPNDYFSLLSEALDESEMYPGPTFDLIMRAGNSADTAVASLRARYVWHTEEIYPQVIETVYEVVDWQFGSAISMRCGPLPSTRLTYTEPLSSRVLTARISIDCATYKNSWDVRYFRPIATMTIAPATP